MLILARKRKSLSASLVLAAPPQIDFFTTYTQIHKDKRYEFETQNCAYLIITNLKELSSVSALFPIFTLL